MPTMTADAPETTATGAVRKGSGATVKVIVFEAPMFSKVCFVGSNRQPFRFLFRGSHDDCGR